MKRLPQFQNGRRAAPVAQALCALAVCCAGIAPGLAAAAETNDYPTLDRVGYVLNCMQEHGGQSVENLYACVCRIDFIASQMPFETYEDASTFDRYRRMPGEKGGIFRDNEQAESLLAQLDKTTLEAGKRCPLVRRSVARPPALPDSSQAPSAKDASGP